MSQPYPHLLLLLFIQVQYILVFKYATSQFSTTVSYNLSRKEEEEVLVVGQNNNKNKWSNNENNFSAPGGLFSVLTSFLASFFFDFSYAFQRHSGQKRSHKTDKHRSAEKCHTYVQQQESC